MKKWILILPLSLLALSACKDRPKQTTARKERTETTVRAVPAAVPDSVLLDTAAQVKGYETNTYKLPVPATGTYRAVAASKNTGIVFVIQDAEGKNLTDETDSWSGELKRGNYTLIVGLTRNAARKNAGNTVDYSVRVVSDRQTEK